MNLEHRSSRSLECATHSAYHILTRHMTSRQPAFAALAQNGREPLGLITFATLKHDNPVFFCWKWISRTSLECLYEVKTPEYREMWERTWISILCAIKCDSADTVLFLLWFVTESEYGNTTLLGRKWACCQVYQVSNFHIQKFLKSKVFAGFYWSFADFRCSHAECFSFDSTSF